MNEFSVEEEKDETMTTTHLFVELLVIGFGAVLWIVLLGAAVFGLDETLGAQASRSLLALLPLLSVAYVLGIVIDRVADSIFEPWDRRHLRTSFDEDRKRYFEARRILVVRAPELWAHLEYGRSRLRICRGWALNAAALLVALNVLDYARQPGALDGYSLYACNFALALLLALCVVSWRMLNRSEYKKILRQSKWVVEKMNRVEDVSDVSKEGQEGEQVQGQPG